MVCGGVRTEQNSTIFWFAGYEQNNINYFLGGGVQTEHNSTFFWVAGYEQNIIQLFSMWRGTNRTKLSGSVVRVLDYWKLKTQFIKRFSSDFLKT